MGRRAGAARRPATSGRRRSGRRGPRRPARSPARPRRRCRRGAGAGRAAARTRGPAGDRGPRRPDAAGTRRAAAAGTTARRSGPAWPMCVRVQLGQLGVVGQDRARSMPAPARRPRRARRRRPRERASRDAGGRRRRATVRSTRHGPAGRSATVRRAGRALRRRASRSAAARRRRAATRARRPCSAGRRSAVVHAEQLADERLADPLEVAQGQVALVELAVGDALLDDPGDHRPDGRLVARRERADRRLDAVGEHDQGRLARSAASARRGGTSLVDRGGRLRPSAVASRRRRGRAPSARA